MNQYTSYCSGQCVFPQNKTAFDYSTDLPYAPGFDAIQGDTISLNATLSNGKYLQAEVHNFVGMLQAQVTYSYLKKKNERPFLLTRSGTLGSNRYAIHWSGDNQADFYFLKTSIIDNINNQIWGYQMMGADICGFSENAKEQICARWYQLGSLYPFSRNHNSIHATDQQPYALGDIVVQAARNNLKFRYSILKHYYTLFVQKNGYGTMWNSLFFVFPDDESCYLNENADTQFMIDNFLLFTPILEQNTTTRKIYLPLSKWYLLPDAPIRGNPVHYGSGYNQISNILLTSLIPSFLKSGKILFQQNTSGVLNTKQLDNVFTVTAGLGLNMSISNDTYQGYYAQGNLMSIQNYQNQTQINLCLKSNCFYQFYMTLYQPRVFQEDEFSNLKVENTKEKVNNSRRYIKLFVYYRGDKQLNESIQISQINAYLPTQTTIIGFNCTQQSAKHKISSLSQEAVHQQCREVAVNRLFQHQQAWEQWNPEIMIMIRQDNMLMQICKQRRSELHTTQQSGEQIDILFTLTIINKLILFVQFYLFNYMMLQQTA